MVKKKKASSANKKHSKTFATKLKKFKLYRHKYLVAVGLVVIVLLSGWYFNQPEDLGEQLPPPPADALYKQPNRPIDARVEDLLARMTLEEKIGQMALVDKNSLGEIGDISKYYLGGVLSGAGAKPETNTPQGWVDMVGGMKEQASKSRLGIPILYGVDANHGHSNVLGATVFPHAIGLGASGDAKLVEQVADITSDELSATGINWSYSPSLDAPKDMRWGRVYEAFSDSPELISELGSAYIDGAQTLQADNTYVMSSAKHYLATGAMQWGKSNHKKFKIDQGITAVDEKALANEYLPPYKSAVDAGVASVMVGLNQWGNERIIDSKYLITDKLKNELGFEGFVVSDWYGVYEYSRTSKYDANIKTINAGLDMAMLPYDYKDFMNDVRKAVNNGEISQTRIDDAVSRILYQKFKAGLFDVKSGNIDTEIVGSEEHRQVARETVASSAVLLKNSESLLPLPKKSGRILVAGSGADNVGRQSGAWTIEWQGVDGNWMPGGTSILQGIREVVGDNSMIDYEQDGMFDSDSTKADVGIAIVSEKPYAEGWGDNANPTIEADDLEVIERLKKSTKKIVVIILSGRPLIIADQLPSWDVVVAGWLPGSEGAGIADVLFGNHPFTAKLPLPWPATIQQLPIESNGITNDGSEALFKRGFGL
ncbi:glycoside hydrolase family 3 C-terminal domain-containing protein [Candidatus Saccharibacteria bacterium]|nr:glycoside hydrolase family 3 C-terminal domain-containing protein [Candidatus Saccharibacteria bacterium]